MTTGIAATAVMAMLETVVEVETLACFEAATMFPLMILSLTSPSCSMQLSLIFNWAGPGERRPSVKVSASLFHNTKLHLVFYASYSKRSHELEREFRWYATKLNINILGPTLLFRVAA